MQIIKIPPWFFIRVAEGQGEAGQVRHQAQGCSPQGTKTKPLPTPHPEVPGALNGWGLFCGAQSTELFDARRWAEGTALWMSSACFSHQSPWCEKWTGALPCYSKSTRNGRTRTAHAFPKLGSPCSREGQPSVCTAPSPGIVVEIF